MIKRLVLAPGQRVIAFIMAQRQLSALRSLHEKEKGELQRDFEDAFALVNTLNPESRMT